MLSMDALSPESMRMILVDVRTSARSTSIMLLDKLKLLQLDNDSPNSLLALSLVSRSYHDLVVEFVFRSIVLDPSNWRFCMERLHGLRKNDRLKECVRNISITGLLSEDQEALLCELLLIFSCLQTVKYGPVTLVCCNADNVVTGARWQGLILPCFKPWNYLVRVCVSTLTTDLLSEIMMLQ